MLRQSLKRLLSAIALGGLVYPSNAEILYDWQADAAHLDGSTFKATRGPNGKLLEAPTLDTEDLLEFAGKQYVEFPESAARKIPSDTFSIEAMVRIDRPQRWGSIAAFSQDNGSYERGWLLGHTDERFCFKVSTGGPLLQITSNKPFSLGQWAHLVGVFDGKTAKLFVDGALAASKPVDHELVLPDIPTPFVLGTYKDKDECFPLHGRIRQLRIHDSALSATEITQLQPRRLPFTVRPFVRFLGPASAEIVWESSEPGTGIVSFGTTPKLGQILESDSQSTHHKVQLKGLLPATVYHFRIAARSTKGLVSGPLQSFDTSVSKDPRGKPRGISEVQIHLPTVQFSITSLSSLLRNIGRYRLFASMLPHRIHEVTLPPELTSPQFPLHFWNLRKDFSCNHALHRPHDLRHTIHRH